VLTAFADQEVNVSIEGRVLSAAQEGDTWQSRAYTVCLPFDLDLWNVGNSGFKIYSTAEVNEAGELCFIEEMIPYINSGRAYLVVMTNGHMMLQANGVTLSNYAAGPDELNNVVSPLGEGEPVGYWLGSLKTIGHDEAVNLKAFTLTNFGSFQRITDENPAWKWPAYRAMFCATNLMTADILPTKYRLDSNGEEEEEDLSQPAPNSYQGDNEGGATSIAPVIHTIDRDGTERWFDINGRQLSGKPTKKGIYINKGNKILVK